MKEERIQYGDILMIIQGYYLFEFINVKNNASFCIGIGGIQYYDPFGNSMISYPTAIRVDKNIYSLKTFTDEVTTPTGIAVLLPYKEIQEIANKTFFEEGQFHAINFLNTAANIEINITEDE